MNKNDLREELAQLAHEQWLGWMAYLFAKSTLNEDGTATIPRWAVERWMRQVKTSYHDLPDNEKQSDKEEADKVLEILKQNNIYNGDKPYRIDPVILHL